MGFVEGIGVLLSALASGAGGGILGGILGIFKQKQERLERVEMAKIAVRRDELEYQNAKLEREHALLMLSKTGELELQKVQAETEAEMEVANQRALASAQQTLKNLDTTSGMDNYRASVRPTMAYWAAFLFTAMLIWAFANFYNTIDAEAGRQILMNLFGTLTFTLTSVVTFYYVARRNHAPRL